MRPAASLNGMAQARQVLWNRIYMLDYFVIPALQSDYEYQLAHADAASSALAQAQGALESARATLAQLKSELHTLDAPSRRPSLGVFDVRRLWRPAHDEPHQSMA